MRRGSPGRAGRRRRCRREISAILLGLAFLTATPATILAADTIRPSVTSLSVSPSRFSPNSDGVSDRAAIRFRLSERCSVTIRILSPVTGATVRTVVSGLRLYAGARSVVWDGKNDAGSVLPDGRYTVRIFACDMARNKALRYPYSLQTWIDTVKPNFSALSVSPNPFSPNATPDGRNDTTKIRITISEAGYANFSISGNSHVRTIRNVYCRTAGTFYVSWNGLDNSRVRVDDGSYAVTVNFRDVAGNPATVPSRGTSVAVDTVRPAVSGLTLVPSVITPLARTNSTGALRYGLAETCAFSFSIRNPAGTRLRGGSVSALGTGAHSTTWNAKQVVGSTSVAVPNGRYPITMLFTDKAGNRTSIVRNFVVRSYYLVCVDPGHGGKNGVYDSGAVGPTGLRESVVNFDIGYNRLRLVLAAIPTETLGYPVKVLMTRVKERDPSMTLDKRSSLANFRGANVFISIHCDSFSLSSHGTSTWYYDDGSSRGDKSAALASMIQSSVLKKTGLYNRGTREEGFYVLTHTRMPAALHEAAFISNRKEEYLLKQSYFKARVANGISEGIIRFFKAYP